MALRNWTLRVAVFLALFATQPAFCQQPVAPGGAAVDIPDLRMHVTGYLLGYYRIPDFQTEDFLGSCWEGSSADDRWGKASPAVLDLKKRNQIPFSRGDDAVTVGMGDNFGIDLGSRVYRERDQLRPKQRDPGYVAGLNGAGKRENPGRR